MQHPPSGRQIIAPAINHLSLLLDQRHLRQFFKTQTRNALPTELHQVHIVGMFTLLSLASPKLLTRENISKVFVLITTAYPGKTAEQHYICAWGVCLDALAIAVSAGTTWTATSGSTSITTTGHSIAEKFFDRLITFHENALQSDSLSIAGKITNIEHLYHNQKVSDLNKYLNYAKGLTTASTPAQPDHEWTCYIRLLQDLASPNNANSQSAYPYTFLYISLLSLLTDPAVPHESSLSPSLTQLATQAPLNDSQRHTVTEDLQPRENTWQPLQRFIEGIIEMANITEEDFFDFCYKPRTVRESQPQLLLISTLFDYLYILLPFIVDENNPQQKNNFTDSLLHVLRYLIISSDPSIPNTKVSNFGKNILSLDHSDRFTLHQNLIKISLAWPNNHTILHFSISPLSETNAVQNIIIGKKLLTSKEFIKLMSDILPNYICHENNSAANKDSDADDKDNEGSSPVNLKETLAQADIIQKLPYYFFHKSIGATTLTAIVEHLENCSQNDLITYVTNKIDSHIIKNISRMQRLKGYSWRSLSVFRIKSLQPQSIADLFLHARDGTKIFSRLETKPRFLKGGGTRHELIPGIFGKSAESYDHLVGALPLSKQQLQRQCIKDYTTTNKRCAQSELFEMLPCHQQPKRNSSSTEQGLQAISL